MIQRFVPDCNLGQILLHKMFHNDREEALIMKEYSILLSLADYLAEQNLISLAEKLELYKQIKAGDSA